jgi:co-chaperonin GroES (HSP10)
VREIDKSMAREIRPDRPSLPTPYFGYALVRVVMPGETEGGIQIPQNVQESEMKLYIVAASSGHNAEGALVPCELASGDRVHLSPQLVSEPDGKGGVKKRKVIRAIEVGDERLKEYRWIMLGDVIGFERKGQTH